MCTFGDKRKHSKVHGRNKCRKNDRFKKIKIKKDKIKKEEERKKKKGKLHRTAKGQRRGRGL